MENARLDRAVHPDTRVADGEHHVGADLGSEVLARIGFIEVHVGGLDGEFASGGHGVACIDRQIEDDLFEVGAIGEQPAESRGRQSTPTSSPRTRRSKFPMSASTSFKWMTVGVMTCWRLNVRSCLVNCAALSAACRIRRYRRAARGPDADRRASARCS